MNQRLPFDTLPSLPSLPVGMAIQLPDGKLLGEANAPVKILFSKWSSLIHLKTGQVGALAQEYAEGHVQLEGNIQALVRAMIQFLHEDPTQEKKQGNLTKHLGLLYGLKSLANHTQAQDAANIQFHYDISDAFYALWLDPQRVYSCAYYRNPSMSLAQAQQAKLDHICRKLMLQSGERFLDIGTGWGSLILWAAEHYGVDATGITLSKNQYTYVQQLIKEKNLAHRVRIELCDYRELDENQPFEKISSVGMFEHVGQAHMNLYFKKIMNLLIPGGLVLNHGITAGGVENRKINAGMGEFIEKYIFPGGELLHISKVMAHLAHSGLEMVDSENLRPHYARTLWDWSTALEEQLDQARQILTGSGKAVNAEKTLRAYRVYLAASAIGFEQGWLSLYQLLAIRPNGSLNNTPIKGAQSVYPFNREYMYCS